MLRYSLLALFAFAPLAHAQDVNEENEKAMKAAIAKASPWVAKIETAGGTGAVGGGGGAPGGPAPVRKGVGPTTGLVVSADGYVISSAFNFANKPTDIFVTVPGKPRMVAKIVANDTSRMLTLLKIDAKDLAVPTAFPKAEIKVGMWTLALGRALDNEDGKTPSVSRGIVSALDRIWGKLTQTDCKVSPINYGGPLVAIDGRVMGVLVPASPNGEGESAGVEWYDGGIGFSVPLDDINAILPRLKEGKDIRRGMLGFNPKTPDEMYNMPVVVGNVAPQSVSEKIGLKVNDKITSLDGKPVENFKDLMMLLGPKYEGDKITLTVERDGKTETFKDVALGGTSATFSQRFLGILPMRDDPEPGVEVRYVYPKSPADVAGIKAGDRIMKFGPAPAPMLTPITGGRTQLSQIVRSAPLNLDFKAELKRKAGDKIEPVVIKLASLGEELPEKAESKSSKAMAFGKEKKENDKELEVGFKYDLANKTTGRKYWRYLPDNYDVNKSYGVIVWLHDAGKGGKEKEGKDVFKIWEEYCDSANFILIGPQAKNGVDWVATEAEELTQTIQQAIAGFTIDRSRVVVHGMGNGGSMAMYLAFTARDLVRAAVVSGAVLNGNAKDNLPAQPLSFYIVAGDKDPLIKEIKETNEKLKAKKFPVIFRELKDFGKEYLDQKTLEEICSWLDALDRI